VVTITPDRWTARRSATQAGVALNPTFTISRARASASSDNPTYLAQRERLFDGLRKAGCRRDERRPRQLLRGDDSVTQTRSRDTSTLIGEECRDFVCSLADLCKPIEIAIRSHQRPALD